MAVSVRAFFVFPPTIPFLPPSAARASAMHGLLASTAVPPIHGFGRGGAAAPVPGLFACYGPRSGPRLPAPAPHIHHCLPVVMLLLPLSTWHAERVLFYFGRSGRQAFVQQGGARAPAACSLTDTAACHAHRHRDGRGEDTEAAALTDDDLVRPHAARRLLSCDRHAGRRGDLDRTQRACRDPVRVSRGQTVAAELLLE